MRFVARLAAMTAALGGALVLHGAWRLVGARSPWPRRLLGLIGRIAGARARVEGTPLEARAVILSNHQSWLDILLLAGTSGAVFVAKAELRGAPLVGWLCTMHHTIFVRRGDRSTVAASIAELRAALDQPRPVGIFPEGTTSDGTALLPFKAALLDVFSRPVPGMRIQPVFIDYGSATADIAWVGAEPGAANAARILRRPGHIPATVHYLAPFDPSDHPDRKAIAAEARRRIEAAMADQVAGTA